MIGAEHNNYGENFIDFHSMCYCLEKGRNHLRIKYCNTLKKNGVNKITKTCVRCTKYFVNINQERFSKLYKWSVVNTTKMNNSFVH